MAYVTLSVCERIATVTMSDPGRRNALSAGMIAELIAAFDALDGDVRAVVLAAAPGTGVWCAGFDIGALEAVVDPLAPDGALHALFDRVQRCPAAVIAMLNGSTWGGGTDLALRCDMRIADETARLAFTPARLGLPYDLSGLLHATWCMGPALVFEMFATGEPIGAERALAIGLVNRVVAPDRLREATYQVAATIAGNAPLSVASMKAHARALVASVAVAPEVLGALQEMRAVALSSQDYREGRQAFRDKRRAVFRGE